MNTFNIVRDFSEKLPEDEIKRLWQEPNALAHLLDPHKSAWYLHGTKGCGKTALVTYLSTIGTFQCQATGKVINMRFADWQVWKDPFYIDLSQIANSIQNELNQASKTTLQRRIQPLLDAPLYIIIVKQVLKWTEHSNNSDTIALQQILSTLSNAQLCPPDQSSISELRDVLIKFLAGDRLRSANSIEKADPYIDASLIRDLQVHIANLLNDSRTQHTILIDSVDDDFEYSAFDMAYVSSLAQFVLRFNKMMIELQGTLRLVLSLPSEIFDEMTGFNQDHIEPHSVRLYWNNTAALESMLISAIYNELHRLHSIGQIPKVPSKSRLRQLALPSKFLTQHNHERHLLEYVAQVTQYNPRQFIAMCNSILDNAHKGTPYYEVVLELDKLNHSELQVAMSNAVMDYSGPVWDATSTRAQRMYNTLLSVTSGSYSGLEAILNEFEGHYSIAPLGKMLEIINRKGLELLKTSGGSSRRIVGTAIIQELYSLGLVALLTSDRLSQPTDSQRFTVKLKCIQETTVAPASFEYVVFVPFVAEKLGMRLPLNRFTYINIGSQTMSFSMTALREIEGFK